MSDEKPLRGPFEFNGLDWIPAEEKQAEDRFHRQHTPAEIREISSVKVTWGVKIICAIWLTLFGGFVVSAAATLLVGLYALVMTCVEWMK